MVKTARSHQCPQAAIETPERRQQVWKAERHSERDELWAVLLGGLEWVGRKKAEEALRQKAQHIWRDGVYKHSCVQVFFEWLSTSERKGGKIGGQRRARVNQETPQWCTLKIFHCALKVKPLDNSQETCSLELNNLHSEGNWKVGNVDLRFSFYYLFICIILFIYLFICTVCVCVCVCNHACVTEGDFWEFVLKPWVPSIELRLLSFYSKC